MAAYEEDDMKWLDYEEQMQHPKSDEEEAEYEFLELEMAFGLRESERAGVPAGGGSFSDNVDSHKHESEALHVRCRSPRRSASSITPKHVYKKDFLGPAPGQFLIS